MHFNCNLFVYLFQIKNVYFLNNLIKFFFRDYLIKIREEREKKKEKSILKILVGFLFIKEIINKNILLQK